MPINAGYRLGRAGLGGGSGRVGALLRQTGETEKGLFVSTPLADEMWHLRGSDRDDEEAAVGAYAEYEAGSARLRLNFFNTADTPELGFNPIFGNARKDLPETVNTYMIAHSEYPSPGPATRASYSYGDLRINAPTIGALGNDNTFSASLGDAAVDAVNAVADIALSTGRIRVRAPNAPMTAASTEVLRAGNNYLNVVYHMAGLEGNGFIIRISYNSSGSAGVAAPTVLRDSSNNVIGIEVGCTGVVTLAAIRTALNGVSVGGTQLVTATQRGGSGSRAFLDTSNDGDFVLEGGTDGSGAATNRGNIRAVRGAVRAGAVGATAKYEGSTTAGFLTFSWFEPGTDGNGFTILRRAGSGAGVRAFYEDNGNTYEDLVVHGPQGSTAVERIELRNAVNAARDSSNRQLIVATTDSEAIGQLAGFFPATNQPDIERTLSGGTAGTLTNPLTVTYAASTNIMRVTGLPTDTAAQVVIEITKLAQFQSGDGDSPGDVWYIRGGTDTSTLTVPDTAGLSFRNGFSGGVDATPRDPLVWFIFAANNSTYQFDLTGIASGDTVKNAIDAPITWAGAGPRIDDLSTIMSSVSNDTSTALTAAAQGQTAFTGGKDTATRQNPRISVVSTSGGTVSYRCQYHGPGTQANMRSTLTELLNAWGNIANVPGISPGTIITGTATARVTAVPTGPSNGQNYQPREDIQALFHPTEAWPNVEVRYETTDTLQAIHDALEDQGVYVRVVYDTDLTAAPEAVGFARRMA